METMNLETIIVQEYITCKCSNASSKQGDTTNTVPLLVTCCRINCHILECNADIDSQQYHKVTNCSISLVLAYFTCKYSNEK